MEYRTLGRTGLRVSAVALGCEGFMHKRAEEVKADFDFAIRHGINFVDIYSSNPDLRANIGAALEGRRGEFIIQGHLCTVWENDQYLRTRDPQKSADSFERQLRQLRTDYLDVGMIHYVDAEADLRTVFDGPIIRLAQRLKAEGRIRSIGLSSHNPAVARMAVETGLVDVLMFSINPAYDLQPASENVDALWAGYAMTQSVPMQALASAKSGAQPVTVNFRYEYVDASARSSSQSDVKISVPISQPDRFEISDPVVPDQVIAGQENTVTMEYVNKGKGDIANVEATMEGEGFDATMKTQYVGNVASGATGTIGYAFTPHASGELKTTLKVTYEDSDGQTKTKEFPLTIPVTDMQPMDDSGMADPNMEQNANQGLPVLVYVVIVVIAVVIIVVIVLLVRRRRKQKAKKNDIDEDWDDWSEGKDDKTDTGVTDGAAADTAPITPVTPASSVAPAGSSHKA